MEDVQGEFQQSEKEYVGLGGIGVELHSQWLSREWLSRESLKSIGITKNLSS